MNYLEHQNRIKVQIIALNLLSAYLLLHDLIAQDAVKSGMGVSLYYLLHILWETTARSSTPALS